MATKQTSKKVELNEDGSPTGKIIFTFADGSAFTFDSAKMSEQIKLRAMVHGFSQKLGDSYASAAQQDNPTEFCKAMVSQTTKNLENDDWRANAGEGASRVTDLATAVSRATGMSIEEAVARLEKSTDEQKKALREKAKVKRALADIAAERATARAKKLAEQAADEDDELDLPEVDAA